MMIEVEEAERLAKVYLESRNLSSEVEMQLAGTAPFRRDDVLYFDCQSADYLRTGNWRDMAIGSGPVAVDLKSGECRMIGAAELPELGL
jgi:hypothetical protein